MFYRQYANKLTKIKKSLKNVFKIGNDQFQKSFA